MMYLDLRCLLYPSREGSEDDYIRAYATYGEDPSVVKLKISSYLPSGTYVLDSISVTDKAGNNRYYEAEPDEGYTEKLPDSISITVTNDDEVDTEAPKVNRISIDKTDLKAGESTTVTIEASDDVSGLEMSSVSFKREGSEDDYIRAYATYGEDPSVVKLKISSYLPSGTYVLDSISVTDKAGNNRYYEAEPDEGYTEKLPDSISITVTNDDEVDTEAPKVNRISIDKTDLKAGESTTVTIEASDDVSGLEMSSVSFKREGSEDDYIRAYATYGEDPSVVKLEISPYLPSGTYVLDSISVTDKAGNNRYYEAEPDEGYTEKLPNSLKITVINDDPVTPPTTPEHKPSRPDGSTGNSAGSSANSSNASGVVNYESEKPDPADKQAVKAYNFWQDAKSKIRKTAEGKTLRLSVPKEITNMPASVMETLRKENVGLRLNWNGKTITIPAGKAQPKQKMRIYWTMQTLEKLYNA